jgi:hypothetical protein
MGRVGTVWKGLARFGGWVARGVKHGDMKHEEGQWVCFAPARGDGAPWCAAGRVRSKSILENGTFRDILGHWLIEAERHEGTQARSGDQAGRERVRRWLVSLHLIPLAFATTSCLRASMPSCLFTSCLDAFVPVAHYLPLCKTGAVLRFGDHFCAAVFGKVRNCRGIWGEIVLELLPGRVGFLVNGAQRAEGFRSVLTTSPRLRRTSRATAARRRTMRACRRRPSRQS